MVLEGFEKFTQQGRSFNPKISIRKRGQIGFNNGAIKRFKLNNFDFAIMYINKERTKVAFQFTNEADAEGAAKIVKKKNNFFVSGKSFLDYFNISYEESRIYSVDWKEDQKVAIIDIIEHDIENPDKTNSAEKNASPQQPTQLQ